MRSSLYTLAGGAASALAATRGFNYASQGNTLETFTNQFESAQAITDYASARLYTMIQDGTANTVISAIPAAIKTNTTLLLGLWASENQEAFNNELSALKTAISQYGSQGLADLTVGISVGSEDLYRISETGIKQNSGYGQTADVLVDYIKQVRELVKDTVLADVPIGHVDTWNAYTNTSNSAILDAVDFFGLDEYPFYQDGEGNSIDNASDLFWKAYNKVEAVAGGKPLWITETGWPIKGKTEDEAVPSVENAAKFWQDVACELEARCINFWWYILNDDGSSPSFSVASGIDGANTKALYDLKCKNVSTCGASNNNKGSSSSSASASASGSKTASAGSAGSTGSFGVNVNAANASASVEPVVYVTAVTTQYTTTCPVGHVLTQSGKATTLTAPSVITTSGVISSTVSTSQVVVPTTVVNSVTKNGKVVESTQVTWAPTSSIAGAIVPSGAAAPSGVAGASGYAAASGSGSAPNGQAAGTTLASSWAANQTPGASATTNPSSYKGAGSKVGGSVALALGAAAVALL